MPKQKRADKLKNKGDKRRKTDNLEVVLREDLAQSSGIVQPKPPRAPKQRSRADSDDDELDEAAQRKIETLARAQASDELQREVQIMRDDSSSDDESEDDLGLDDDGEDIDGLDFGAEALSPSQSAQVAR